MHWIKKLYLYVVSLVSLIIIVVAAIMLVSMGLKQWVFTKADMNVIYPSSCVDQPSPDGKMQAVCSADFEAKQAEAQRQQQASNKQRELAQAISMIVVATPVFWYHWKLARKEA